MGIKKTDFKMEQALDTIGEHFVQASFNSIELEKEFSFFVKVVIREKKGKVEKKPEAKKEGETGKDEKKQGDAGAQKK